MSNRDMMDFQESDDMPLPSSNAERLERKIDKIIAELGRLILIEERIKVCSKEVEDLKEHNERQDQAIYKLEKDIEKYKNIGFGLVLATNAIWWFVSHFYKG